MARTSEASNHGIPQPPDTEAWRHFGDGTAGRIVAARIQGYDPGTLAYVDVQVDVNGVVQTAGGGGAGGAVTQGTSPWVVSAASLPLPTGAAKDSTLTDGTARIGGTVAVTGTFFQVTQPVSIASMPSTPVTGPLTDTQLRASAVPVSLATAPTTAVTQSTSPWVTNDPGLPDTLGQKTMANSTGVTIASDQTSFPVAATLAAETTKVIGTVNQGTSPWVISGALTDTQLRATPVPVSGTVAATQGTSPWVTSRNWTLASGTDSVTVGNATMPTTPVTGTFWQSTQPVSIASMPTTAVTAATLPLPTNAATELGGQLQQAVELLQQLLIEMRIQSMQLGQGLNVLDDPAALRNDPAYLN